MRRLGSIPSAVAAWVVVAAGTAPAAATTVDVFDPVAGPRGSPGQILVTGNPGANRIVVHWSNKRRALIVEDTHRIKSEECDRLGPKRVSCPFDFGDLRINGRTGQDRLVVQGKTTRFETVSVDAGPGRDVVLGGDGSDSLVGGLGDDRLRGRGALDFLYGDDLFALDHGPPGDDVLRGGAGNDYLGDFYDHGSDSLFGDGGDDHVEGRDNSADRVIDGGSGTDDCTSDPIDPAPVSCEHRG